MPAEYTNQPNMTDAEFRLIREQLGLTADWLAAHLRVTPRTVRFWEEGRYAIPDKVQVELQRLDAETTKTVARWVQRLLDIPNPKVVTFRTDAEYLAARPQEGKDWPASWHRAITGRAAREVPGLSIVYPPRPPNTTRVTVTIS